MFSEKNLDKIANMLKDDDVRRAVIDVMAKDFAQDFLVPVRINFDSTTSMPVVSCKEWQE